MGNSKETKDCKYDCLRLQNQLCFPLYACSKEIVRRYKPYLDKIDLTYTQYITMMVLWEEGQVSVKELGEKLMLDSGTLTPVLKKLEQKGYLTRSRDKDDERVLNVTLTAEGEALKDQAVDIPKQMGGCMKLSPEDAEVLYKVLYKVLQGLGPVEE
ncbi:MAG: MarR family transcriptional regulator [Lachnospiraceae bacterium]|nr:MarR family transcriptional regulator [Lachnospiraceae bacterium]